MKMLSGLVLALMMAGAAADALDGYRKFAGMNHHTLTPINYLRNGESGLLWISRDVYACRTCKKIFTILSGT